MKEINGTYYHDETPIQVINILEQNRQSQRQTRIRLYYGDTKTGKCWNEEHDIMGYIGRSTGSQKIPLLINNRRSIGGSAILDHCIVRIDIARKGYKPLYIHPNFHVGEITISDPPEKIGNIDMKQAGYTTGVYIDGSNHANFKNYDQAVRFVQFLKGERYSK
jgi:hypothetical protein